MTRTPNEKNVVDRIQKYLKSRGAWVYKTHGSQFGRSGVPDLIACYHGFFLAFEVKKPHPTDPDRMAPDSKVSSLQKIEIDRIRKADGEALVVWSVEQVKRVLDVL